MTSSRRTDALVVAAETLDALGIDQSYVIDPFAAIDRLGLALCITKLDNLLGAVVPQGTGGVLITSERSPAIQRYTAAHEIGHWILHEDQLQVDGEADVLGSPSNKIEREAQLFAGYFLMPPALLDRAVSAYDLQAGRVTPEQVYRLSRDLDVSYEAAARRLRTARLLDDAQLRDILSFGRMPAMRRASAGYRPFDGRADVWDATSDEEVVRLVVEERDEVLMGLPEQRLAGWRWLTAEELADRDRQPSTPRPRPAAPSPAVGNGHPVAPIGQDAHTAPDHDRVPDSIPNHQDTSAAALVNDSFDADHAETPAQRRRRRTTRAEASAQTSIALNAADPLVGGTGTRTLVVRTTAPGQWSLHLYYAHAYDPRQEPLLTYELQLSIQPTPNTAFRTRRLRSNLDQRLMGDPEDNVEFEVA